MLRWDSYVIEVDWEKNCYKYEGFRYLTMHYRSWRIIREDKRIEVVGNKYLKEEED